MNFSRFLLLSLCLVVISCTTDVNEEFVADEDVMGNMPQRSLTIPNATVDSLILARGLNLNEITFQEKALLLGVLHKLCQQI